MNIKILLNMHSLEKNKVLIKNYFFYFEKQSLFLNSSLINLLIHSLIGSLNKLYTFI
jgi:hypothetical protein